VLDDGDYPDGVKISGTQMRYLEEHVIARHAFHGEWNYTVRPAPGQPPQEEAPPAPGPDLAALAALAGVADLAGLLDAVTVPWQAAREQRLHLDRGGPRTHAGPSAPVRLPFEAAVAAAACHHRLGVTCRLPGRLLGASESTVSQAALRLTPILEQHGITPRYQRARISALDDLHEYAAARGITITPVTTQEPQDTMNQDDTPETVK